MTQTQQVGGARTSHARSCRRLQQYALQATDWRTDIRTYRQTNRWTAPLRKATALRRELNSNGRPTNIVADEDLHRYSWRMRQACGLDLYVFVSRSIFEAFGFVSNKNVNISVSSMSWALRFRFCPAMLYIIAAHAFVWCPPVRPSVRPSRSWILSKRVNIFTNVFLPSASGSHTILVFFFFSIPNVMAIFLRGPL